MVTTALHIEHILEQPQWDFGDAAVELRHAAVEYADDRHHGCRKRAVATAT